MLEHRPGFHRRVLGHPGALLSSPAQAWPLFAAHAGDGDIRAIRKPNSRQQLLLQSGVDDAAEGNNKTSPMNELLLKPRQVTTGWLVVQSESLLKIAEEKSSHTALIYAALEARNALERVVFELIVVACGAHPPEAIVEHCRRKDGVFQALGKVIPHYRLHLEFTNLVLEVDDAPFRCAQLDIKRCKRLWSELAQYCHFIADPKKTIDAEMQTWLAAGVAIVKEADAYLRTTLTRGQLSILPTQNMPPETKEIFEKFVIGKISKSQARRSLELLTPGLKLRKGL